MGGAVGPQGRKEDSQGGVGAMPSLLPHPPHLVSIPHPSQTGVGGRLHKVTSFINLIQHKGDMG